MDRGRLLWLKVFLQINNDLKIINYQIIKPLPSVCLLPPANLSKILTINTPLSTLFCTQEEKMSPSVLLTVACTLYWQSSQYKYRDLSAHGFVPNHNFISNIHMSTSRSTYCKLITIFCYVSPVASLATALKILQNGAAQLPFF